MQWVTFLVIVLRERIALLVVTIVVKKATFRRTALKSVRSLAVTATRRVT